MNVFRSRPKGGYIQKANWEELYILTRHWKKDLEFYRDDLKFLDRLINRYIIWITKEDTGRRVHEMVSSLRSVKARCKDLLEKVDGHLSQLRKLVENPENGNPRVFRIEHEHLEDEIADFVKDFRKNRKSVFKITEYVVESEKLEGLLER